jgi:hypothetical protein
VGSVAGGKNAFIFDPPGLLDGPCVRCLWSLFKATRKYSSQKETRDRVVIKTAAPIPKRFRARRRRPERASYRLNFRKNKFQVDPFEDAPAEFAEVPPISMRLTIRANRYSAQDR